MFNRFSDSPFHNSTFFTSYFKQNGLRKYKYNNTTIIDKGLNVYKFPK